MRLDGGSAEVVSQINSGSERGRGSTFAVSGTAILRNQSLKFGTNIWIQRSISRGDPRVDTVEKRRHQPTSDRTDTRKLPFVTEPLSP
ncbi:hypothetical protein NDU88_011543 [Pleurodeles waltl]|uniref:Uncharacterized protein n=1 Tax=Pleurodeles waltl TaxID=8319 RepID=A0AAV7R0A7_PLEWA|nr:hypothetical protein NDU88_011543 [Pleurodeles waltl]